MKLRDFLKVYNFRDVDYDENEDREIYDSKVIRIKYHLEENWYEFGCYDFGRNNEFSSFIKDDFLDSEVVNITLVETTEVRYSYVLITLKKESQ